MPRPLDVLRALADPTRLSILELMLERAREHAAHGQKEPAPPAEGTPHVPFSISAHLGLSQPTVSHHMKVLTEAGLVVAHKKGTKVYYALARSGAEVLRDFSAALAEHGCDDPTA